MSGLEFVKTHHCAVVVHSLPAIVVVTGEGIGGFLGTFCRSSELGTIVRYLGFP